jgi:hypothetical protein
MGWQDDPVVGGGSAPKGNAPWENDPVVGAKPGGETAAKTPSYDDSWTGYAGNIAYRAANTGTLGALDYANAGIHAAGGEGYGDALTKIQKSNQDWEEAHPYAALGADLVGYGAGLGKVGIGAKIAGRIGEGALARMAGAGIENAGASAVSTLTGSQGQATVGDYLKNAAIAGSVGAATGAIPGAKGDLAGTPSPTAKLGADTKAAFTPLETTHYNPHDIGSQFDAIQNSLAGKDIPSGAMKDQLNEISSKIAAKQKAGQSITADDLTNWQIDINKASQGGRDIRVAQAYNDALNNTMASTRPMYSPLPGPASISAQSDVARNAALKENVSSNIDDWIKNAGDSDATKAAILKKVETAPNLFPGGVGDMLTQASQPDGWGGKLGTMLAKDAAGTVAGAGAGYLVGGHDLGGTLVGSAMGLVGAHGAAAIANRIKSQNLLRKLEAARYLNDTGQKVSPGAFKPGIPVVGPMGAYARQSGAGLGVSNLFQ